MAEFNRLDNSASGEMASMEYELARYRLINDAFGIAHWEMEVTDEDSVKPDSKFNWSDEFRRMLGFTDERDFPNILSSWADRLHPADREKTLEAFRAHIYDYTGRTLYNPEYRLKTKTGEYKWFRAIGVTMRDETGAPIRVAGALEDISERMHQQEMLENILNTLDSHVYISDIETDGILFINNKMISDFKLDKDVKGRKCWSLLQEGQHGRCPWCKKGELLANPGAPVKWEENNSISQSVRYNIDRIIEWPGGRKVHMQQGIDVTEMKRAHEELAYQGRMLDTLNQAAISFLSRRDLDSTDEMTRGMDLVASIADFDRMSVFINSECGDGLHMSQVYRWSKEAGGTTGTLGELADMPYSTVFPRWERILRAGECINGPARQMPEWDYIKRFGCATLLAVPVFAHNRFWGFALYENLKEEKKFSSRTTGILRSASLMLSNVIIRDEESKRIHEADERARLMLDATPLAARLWSKDFKLIESNEAAARMFGLRDKEEYIDRYFELTPEYQPDGRKTAYTIVESIKEAFATGRYQFELIYRMPDGTPIPAENTLVRIPYGDDYVVASYTRDLREHNKMIADIKETSKKLEAALEDAREANAAKSSFLAHMSHEIRTPLNAVVGLSELALDDDNLDGEMEDKLGKIHSSGMTILSIVNDILDISKIESGKFEIYPANYDTPSLINDIVTQNIVRIAEKPVIFKLTVGENFPVTLYGDDIRVKQIFNNLLSNAFKYTNSGTVAWNIGFERDGDTFWIVSEVRDTGIGMKPEGLRKLFSDYNQIDAATNRKVQGTGLGLAITKRLVEMMDGFIEAESEYGKGSAFRVRIRQSAVSYAPIGKDVADNLMALRYTLAKRDRQAKLSRVDLSYANVLVVDDIPTNLDVVKGMMKPYKMRIDCAVSGSQAIAMMRAGIPRYDVIFMDHMMPEMDGVEAARIIREDIGTEYAKNIPIIALTANAVVGNEEMFLQIGFSDFLSKPIDIVKLDSVLRRWLRDKSRETACDDMGGETNAAPDAEPAPSPDSIRGLDLKKALELFNGDRGVLNGVLRSYASSTPSILKNLSEYLADEKTADYAISVHGVKGSSYGIKAMAAGAMAERLEHAAKSGDIGDIRAWHGMFVKTVETLINDINEYLKNAQSDGDKPQAASPDPALLNELRLACEAFDMDGVDSAMERLESFEYERGGGLVARLRELVDKMDFEEISVMTFPSRRKLLTASGSGATLRAVKSWLEDKYDVFPVNSWDLIMKYIAQNRPDAILIDAETLDCSAEKTDALRQAKEAARIPVVIVSKAHERPDVIKAVEEALTF
ncbi:MAG: response regulator [Clostridiales bacterium]|jgi:PAS domain S-box-containing protein|nr:response regulator [Clostridiales bacterium]